jgi:Protein of unknown function (DUF3108)
MILKNILFRAGRCLFAAFALLGFALPAQVVQAAAPASAEITYNLFRNGIQLGTITEHFEAKDGTYRATSEARAIGLFALAQREPIRFQSVGDLTKDGLRPQRFEGRQSGKSMSADFDWPGAKLNLAHDGLNHSLALPPGAQDRLSIMYQLMFSVIKKAPFMDFAMTNGRKLEKYRYTAQPGVTIDTPFKRLDTIHLVKQREADDTGTEIWIAPEYGNVPVKVLIIEDDGVRYEQVVTKLEIKR